MIDEDGPIIPCPPDRVRLVAAINRALRFTRMDAEPSARVCVWWGKGRSNQWEFREKRLIALLCYHNWAIYFMGILVGSLLSITPMNDTRTYEEETVMARSTKKGPRRGGLMLLFSTVRLARWQIRKTWWLLLVTGLGILIAVVFVCSIPLYAQIAISAGIRDALSTDPVGPYVTVHSISQGV